MGQLNSCLRRRQYQSIDCTTSSFVPPVHEPPKCKTNTNTDTYYTLHLKTISTDTDYLYSNPPSTLEDDIKKLFNHKIPQWAIPIANKDMYEMKKFISMIRDEQCDIVLDFGANRSIVIHRDLLIARSEYFRSMFNSGMAESDQEVIPMEEEMYDAMNALVEYFYTDRFSTCKTNMMSLVHVVDIYAAEHVRLMEICVKEIYNELNQTNLDSVYEFAKERELPLLQKACEHYIVINQVPNYDSPELELQVQQNTRVCYDNHEYTTSQSNRSFDLVKTIIFGDQECGKTTLWNRLLEQPHRVEYKATIGVDFGAIIWRLPYDNLVNTQIWDTAGVPRFRVITESFFNTSFKIAAVCFAFDRYASFEYAKDVLLGKRLKDYIEQGRKVLLVGLKHDTKHVVRRSEALDLAKLYKIPYHELSALNDENINEFKKYFGNLIYEVAMEEQRVNLSH